MKNFLVRDALVPALAATTKEGAIRELVEPLMQSEMTPEKWAMYEKEIKPFLVPFDAAVSSTRDDGDLDRGSSVITVTKP